MDKLEKWIRIKVDSTGVKAGVDSARKQFKKLGDDAKKHTNIASQSIKRFRDSFSGIAGKIAAISASLAGLKILKFADELSLVESRIRRFTDSEEELITVQARLRKSARDTFTDYTKTAALFSRLSAVTKELGFTQDQIIGMGTALNQTFRLSGSNIQEAASATTQFAQGLGAGALKGDEFRAIQEGNFTLMQLMAEELGVGTGALKTMSTQGKITSKVIANSLIKNMDYLETETSKLAVTSENAFVVLKNEIGEVIELLNNTAGVTARASSLILRISEVIRENQKEIIGFGTGLRLFAEGLLNFFEKTALVITSAIEDPFELLKAFVRKELQFLEGAFLALEEYAGFEWAGVAAEKMNYLTKTLGDAPPATRELKRELQELDLIMQKNVLSIMENHEAMLKLIEKRREAEKSGGDPEAIGDVRTGLQKYNDAIKNHLARLKLVDPAMHKYTLQIREIQKNLADGTINQEDFNVAVGLAFETYSMSSKKLNQMSDEMKTYLQSMELLRPLFAGFVSEIYNLQQALESGSITQEQFNKRVGELQQELSATKPVMVDYMDTITDSIDGFSRDSAQAFTDFITMGKSSFRDFADAIINDLIRMTAQKLIFDQAFGAVSAALPTGKKAPAESANGNVFSSGNIIPFARGGVVDKPTLFPMANGTGLMGESGPEAVMPLKRGANGKLGVSGGSTVVNINVQNNTKDTQVEVEETDNPSGGKEIKIMMSNIETHLANRVATRRGSLFNTLQRGGFSGSLR